MAEDIVLKVLTFNCWGIPFFSKNRINRMNAIADKLTVEDYDIVCLQEVWSNEDYKMIKGKTREQLRYSYYFFSGVFGSGVCIFSRYPIDDVIFHKWPLNGYVHKITHGDWFGGKGVGLFKLKVCNINVNVYIAHLHAEYCKENDEYSAHRVLQAFDTAQFIKMTKGDADAVILGGDLNTEPEDLAYKIICGVAGLSDAGLNSNVRLGTNERASNSYTNLRIAETQPNGKSIDYILYAGSKNYKVLVNNFLQPFPERIPEMNFSYSDHEAIMASLRLIKGSQNESNKIDIRNSLKEAIGICETALRNLPKQRLWYLFFSGLLFIPWIWLGVGYFINNNTALTIGFNIMRFLLTPVLCYTLFMSTLWNEQEKNALKAGCSSMELLLSNLSNNFRNDNNQ